MIRSFIAIEIPEDVRTELGDVQARLKRARLGVKVSWTKIENVHLTLQFLGYIPEMIVVKVASVLTELTDRWETFAVKVGGVGAFPQELRPRVLWVGCDDQSGNLRELANAVQQATASLGFVPEHREFSAHLTLGRIKFPRPDAALTKALDSLKDISCGAMRVGAIHVYQSQLHPEGSIYTKLSSHVLKGA